MDSFQITVLVVATVLLIIIFTTIGILTRYATIEKVYPPIANNCPDYWESVNGNCLIPGSNSKNLGTIYSGTTINLTGNVDATSGIYTPGYLSGSTAINFSDSGWDSLGKNSICAKKTWANTNEISWDGVSNYNSCDD
jgi:hypothetical protein